MSLETLQGEINLGVKPRFVDETLEWAYTTAPS